MNRDSEVSPHADPIRPKFWKYRWTSVPQQKAAGQRGQRDGRI